MHKVGHLTLLVVVILLMICTLPTDGAGIPTTNKPVLQHAVEVASSGEVVTLSGSATADNLLQFRAGNHILGFAPNRTYLAGLDHALSIEFLGTKGVMPKAASSEQSTQTMPETPVLRKVVYQDLWDGISLIYESTADGDTESTYTVSPGANISNIKLRYNVPVEIQKDGMLKFKFVGGYMIESAPIAWQEIDGKRIDVQVAFKVSGDEIGFSVGQYDHDKPLIIDPTYQWHTFHGNDNASSAAIAVDGQGNVYIAGWSWATWGTPLHAFSGPCNIVVLKLSSSGTYQWHTFYGSGMIEGLGIAVDGNSNVYITGYSDGTWGTPLHAPGCNYGSIFVLKIDSDGAYQWHTFYGDSCNDSASGITLDGSGNIYVTGQSDATWGSPLHPFNGSHSNIVVLKLNGSGAYQWHTFYGSGSVDAHFNGDTARSIAVEGSGNVYVTGLSNATWGNPINAFNGANRNLVVLKLNDSGAYQWHTFYGSGSVDAVGYGDNAFGVAADGIGNVYITGDSTATWGIPLNAFSGADRNLVVLKLNGGGAYQWHTFYGNVQGNGVGIAANGSGNIYITGDSPATWGIPLNPFTGSYSNIVVLNLNGSGAYQWHTFYGSGSVNPYGYGPDTARSLAVDDSGNVYVTGLSRATWGNPINAFSGANSNIFIMKLALTTCLNDPVVSVMVNPGVVEIEHFPSISTAYSSMPLGDENMLEMQSLEFAESPNLSRDVIFTLSGGYECGFMSNPGRSIINGTLTISGGTVTIENVILK